MMEIQCCTRDHSLLSRLQTLYGTNNITRMADSDYLKQSGAQENAVSVVDFKYYGLPQGVHFTSPVMVLASVPTFKEGFTLLQLGIRGYGNRHMRDSNLHQAIQNVFDGQIWLPPSIVSSLIDVVGGAGNSEDQESKDALLNALSKREREVALLVAKGMSNQEVADKMFVSLRTVKAHLSSIYEKTGVRNRLELGLALS